MPIAIGAALRPLHKIQYFDPGPLELAVHDTVVVENETVSGQPCHELAVVQTPARAVPDAEVPNPPRRVLRRALPEDFARRERNEARQAEAFRVCKAKIKTLGLSMKLLEAEWAFDGGQVTFHFTAEGRVDFRELVRVVAAALHVRVQMHQVGSRDEAKVYQGIGPCGRPTCCSTFLREFAPVSIRMVKDRQGAQNPSKFTGLCGKLMCCLRYETDETLPPGRRVLPDEGMVVMTPLGRAKVMEVNDLQQMLTVQLESQQFVEVRAKDVGTVDGCVDHAAGGCEGCASDGTLSACAVPTRDRPPGGTPLPMA